MQGRARPSLAELYSWRYADLGDLPNVSTAAEYLRANPGFAYDYQFVDVPDLNGRGESEPIPYFYQVLRPTRIVRQTRRNRRTRRFKPARMESALAAQSGGRVWRPC